MIGRRCTIWAAAAMSLDGFISTGVDDSPSSEAHGGWTSAEDKARFRRLLMTWPDMVVFGRKTWSMLPNSIRQVAKGDGREVVVVSRDSSMLEAVPAEKAVSMAMDFGNRVLICGGGATYSLFANQIQSWYITIEPVFLGHGIKLMADSHYGQPLRLSCDSSHKINRRGTMSCVYSRI